MGLFSGFRETGWNTYYPGRQSVAAVDVTQVFILFFAAVLAAVMVVLVIGSKGREKWTTFLRVVFSLHTGVVIIVCLTGQTWQVSSVHSHCEYVASVPDRLSADIGVMLGLKSVNITLKGTFNETSGSSIHGSIHYNEIFSFDKAYDMQAAFAEGRSRGLPWAILYVLEYFGVDTGGLRWCRAFREAGHFAYILLWCAFAAWCVANLLVSFIVLRGAFMFLFSGALMVGASIAYHTLQPQYPFIVPLQDAYIELTYGWSFWLCLLSGCLTMVTGVIVIVLHWLFPVGTSTVFLNEAQLEKEEVQENTDQGPLEIDTPRMNRIRRFRSYSNPSFLVDMDPISPPPPYEDKQAWVRGAKGSQSCREGHSFEQPRGCRGNQNCAEGNSSDLPREARGGSQNGKAYEPRYATRSQSYSGGQIYEPRVQSPEKVSCKEQCPDIVEENDHEISESAHEMVENVPEIVESVHEMEESANEIVERHQCPDDMEAGVENNPTVCTSMTCQSPSTTTSPSATTTTVELGSEPSIAGTSFSTISEELSTEGTSLGTISEKGSIVEEDDTASNITVESVQLQYFDTDGVSKAVIQINNSTDTESSSCA